MVRRLLASFVGVRCTGSIDLTRAQTSRRENRWDGFPEFLTEGNEGERRATDIWSKPDYSAFTFQVCALVVYTHAGWKPFVPCWLFAPRCPARSRFLKSLPTSGKTALEITVIPKISDTSRSILPVTQHTTSPILTPTGQSWLAARGHF